MSGNVTMHLYPLQQCSNVIIWWRFCGVGLLFVLSCCNSVAKPVESHPHLQSLGKVYKFGVVDNYMNGRSRQMQSFSAIGQLRATRPGAPAETLGLLSSDGSISEAQLMKMDLAAENFTFPRLEVERTLARSNATLMSKEEVIRPFVPCKENMRDDIPSRQGTEEGTDDCVVMAPPHYVRQYKWPHSQLKVIAVFWPTLCFLLCTWRMSMNQHNEVGGLKYCVFFLCT